MPPEAVEAVISNGLLATAEEERTNSASNGTPTRLLCLRRKREEERERDRERQRDRWMRWIQRVLNGNSIIFPHSLPLPLPLPIPHGAWRMAYFTYQSALPTSSSNKPTTESTTTAAVRSSNATRLLSKSDVIVSTVFFLKGKSNNNHGRQSHQGSCFLTSR